MSSHDKHTNPDLDRVKLDQTQAMIVNDLAKIFSKSLEVSEVSIKGFIRRAQREWQLQHSMTVEETEGKEKPSPEERIKQMGEMLELFKTELQTMLKFMPPEKVKDLEGGVSEAIRMYEKKYAYR